MNFQYTLSIIADTDLAPYNATILGAMFGVPDSDFIMPRPRKF